MIPHPHRQKGGAPQLGARHPGETGPFGRYGALETAEPVEDDVDGEQHDQGGEEQQPDDDQDHHDEGARRCPA